MLMERGCWSSIISPKMSFKHENESAALVSTLTSTGFETDIIAAGCTTGIAGACVAATCVCVLPKIELIIEVNIVYFLRTNAQMIFKGLVLLGSCFGSNLGHLIN